MNKSSHSFEPPSNTNCFTKSETTLSTTASTNSITNDKFLEMSVPRCGDGDESVMLSVPCVGAGGIENTIQMIKERGKTENYLTKNPFGQSKYEVSCVRLED